MENSNDITLAMIVGYCLSSLRDIQEQLSHGETQKANAKAYEALKFIKEKTISFNQSVIDSNIREDKTHDTTF